jgi:hypothetical protein
MHVGHTLVFGSAPYSYAHRQNAFVLEFSCTCVSIPITASNLVSGVISMSAFPSSFSTRALAARARRAPSRRAPSRVPVPGRRPRRRVVDALAARDRAARDATGDATVIDVVPRARAAVASRASSSRVARARKPSHFCMGTFVWANSETAMSRSQCVARDGAAPHTPSRDGDDGADGARDPRRRAARARDARGVGDARDDDDDATRRRASGAFERARRFEDARVDDARGRARGRREKDARTIDALERGRRGRRARTRRRGNGDRGRRARRLNARDGTRRRKRDRGD